MPPKKSTKPSAPAGPTVAEIEAGLKTKLVDTRAAITAEQQRMDALTRRQAFLQRDIVAYGDEASSYHTSLRTEEDAALQDSLDRSRHLQNSTRLKSTLEASIANADVTVMELYDEIDAAKEGISKHVDAVAAEEEAAIDDESLTNEQRLRKQGHSLFRQLEFLKCQLAALRVNEVQVEVASKAVSYRHSYSQAWNENLQGGRRELYPPTHRKPTSSSQGHHPLLEEDQSRTKTVLASLPACDFFHQEQHFFTHAQPLRDLLNGQPIYPYHPYVGPRRRVAIIISASATQFEASSFLGVPVTLKLLRDELIHTFDYRVEQVLLGRSRAPDQRQTLLKENNNMSMTTTANITTSSGIGAQMLEEEQRQHRQHLCEIQVVPDSFELAKVSTAAAARRLATKIGMGTTTTPSNTTNHNQTTTVQDESTPNTATSIPCQTHRRYESHSKEWLSDYLRKSVSAVGSSTSGALILIKGFVVDDQATSGPLVAVFPEDAQGSPSHRLVFTPSALLDTLTSLTECQSAGSLLMLDVDGCNGHRGFIWVRGCASQHFAWKGPPSTPSSTSGVLASALLSYLHTLRGAQGEEGSTPSAIVKHLCSVFPSSDEKSSQPPKWLSDIEMPSTQRQTPSREDDDVSAGHLLPPPSAQPLVTTDTIPPFQLTIALSNGVSEDTTSSVATAIQEHLTKHLRLDPHYGAVEVRSKVSISQERQYRPAFMSQIMSIADDDEHHQPAEATLTDISAISQGGGDGGDDDDATPTRLSHHHHQDAKYVSVMRDRSSTSMGGLLRGGITNSNTTNTHLSSATTGDGGINMLLSVKVPKSIQLSTFVQELQTELYYARVTKYLFKTAVTVRVVSVSRDPSDGQQALLSIVASPLDPAERWALKAITSQRAAESQHFKTSKGTAPAPSSSPFVSRKRKLLINSHLTLMSSYQSSTMHTTKADDTTTTASQINANASQALDVTSQHDTIGSSKMTAAAACEGDRVASEVEAIRRVCDAFAGDLSTLYDNEDNIATDGGNNAGGSSIQEVTLYSVFIQGMPVSVLLKTLLPAIEGPDSGRTAWSTLLGKSAGSSFISANIGFELEVSQTVGSSQALSLGGVFPLGQMLYGGERAIRRLIPSYPDRCPQQPPQTRHQVIALMISPSTSTTPTNGMDLPSRRFEQQCQWVSAMYASGSGGGRDGPLGGLLRSGTIVGCYADSQDLLCPSNDDSTSTNTKLRRVLCEVAPTSIVDYISNQANLDHTLLIIFAPRQSERLSQMDTSLGKPIPPRPLIVFGNTPGHRIHNHIQSPVFDSVELRRALSFYLTDMYYPADASGVSPAAVVPPQDNWILL